MESCLELNKALTESQTDEEDAFTVEFNNYLIQFFASDDWQQLHNLQGKIEDIHLDNVKSVKGGIFFTSVYLICVSYKLYKQAMTLAKNYERHPESFKELQTQIIPVLQAIKTELHSKPESTEFATMYENIAKVSKILNQFYSDLVQLTKDVQNDFIKIRIYQSWATGSGFATLAVCVGSAVFADPLEVYSTCLPALGGIAFSYEIYCSLDEDYNKLNQVREDTNKLLQELVKHRTQLQVVSL